jgi:hypothetical protein
MLSTFLAVLTTDLNVHASDIDDHLSTSVGHFVDLILNQHGLSYVGNAEPQLNIVGLLRQIDSGKKGCC